MALIKCSSYGHMVSDRGTKCPKCGTPITTADPAFHAEKKEEVVFEVKSSINHISREETIEAAMTTSTD